MLVYGVSDVGKVREANQDYFQFEMLTENSGYAVVCDGMGGAKAGNIASRLACEVISDYLKRSLRPSMTSTQIETILRSAVYSANTAVYEASQKDEEYRGMGTTVVLLYVDNDCAYIVHVGDSRAYAFSDNTLTQITVDHSMVQTMVDNGQITPDEARVHPSKNVITRALGVGAQVSADLDFADATSGTVILLCSDGLSNYVSAEQIAAELKNFDNRVAQRLVNIANDNGGGDNITAVAVKF